ncbi:MAG: DNA polymerase III subunit beta [Planctomycetaceae bacterium]|nr:DNA polymerase III subunit beta [Planctomycetaceae bacterium]
MKLHCNRQALMAALGVVSGVVPVRTTRDVLKNVKLSLQDGIATLIGTDQEVGIRYDLEGVETDSAGDVLLPTQRVSTILREFTEETVEIEVNQNTLWLRAGSSEFQLSTEDPDEFPPVTGFEDSNYLKIGGKELREMIHRTEFATDVESTRYALGGILVDYNEGKKTITLAATDSRRLAVMTGNCEAEGDLSEAHNNPVIPAKAMKLIERSLTDDDEEVLIAIRGNDAVVKSKQSTIYCRLVEGRFPEYKKVIPANPQVQIDLLVGPFHTAVRQAQIVTNEESRGVDFTFGNGRLKLSSKAADIGESKIELPISCEADDLTITFDPRYVADFLKVLPAEDQVKLDLIDDENAAVFHAGENYTYVVMPLSRDR